MPVRARVCVACKGSSALSLPDSHDGTNEPGCLLTVTVSALPDSQRCLLVLSWCYHSRAAKSELRFQLSLPQCSRSELSFQQSLRGPGPRV